MTKYWICTTWSCWCTTNYWFCGIVNNKPCFQLFKILHAQSKLIGLLATNPVFSCSQHKQKWVHVLESLELWSKSSGAGWHGRINPSKSHFSAPHPHNKPCFLLFVLWNCRKPKHYIRVLHKTNVILITQYCSVLPKIFSSLKEYIKGFRMLIFNIKLIWTLL